MGGVKAGTRLYENTRIVPLVAGRPDPKAEACAWESLNREAADSLFGVIGDGGLWTVRVTKHYEARHLDPCGPPSPPGIHLTIRAEIKSLGE